MELNEVEGALRRTLSKRDAPPVADPVEGVHRGIRRRQRRRTTVAGASALSFVLLAVGGAVGVSTRLHRSTPDTSLADIVPVVHTVVVPQDFRAADLSFVSEQRGWAVGPASCADGRCLSLLQTVDGGTTWRRVDSTGLGACGCAAHVRFASPSVGYVWYGATTLMTVDGGQTWAATPTPAQVTGLEPAAGTVARLLGDHGRFTVELSTPGSASWRTVAGDPGRWTSGQLTRHGSHLVTLLRGTGHSTLLRSDDGGQTWSRQVDPCGTANLGSLSYDVDGSLVGTCRLPGVTTLVTSTGDEGWQAVVPDPALTTPDAVAGREATHLLVAGQGELRLTDDDGGTWTTVATGSVGGSAFLAFTTRKVATWVSGDRSTVWRTADGGATWSQARFS